MTVEEQARYYYALGQAFQQLAWHTVPWTALREKKAQVGDLVMITMMMNTNPLNQIGVLRVDEYVPIPDWGPIHTWPQEDKDAVARGEHVGHQREWEIECLDGELRRFTNVDVIRLPRFEELPQFFT